MMSYKFLLALVLVLLALFHTSDAQWGYGGMGYGMGYGMGMPYGMYRPWRRPFGMYGMYPGMGMGMMGMGYPMMYGK
ncbi:hypothetical protein V3C99_016141 [Haemonchus contortus]